MALLQKLKSLLGFDESNSERGGTREVGVTVEREGSSDDGSDPTESPRSTTADSSVGGSTASPAEPTDTPEEAAEPAESTESGTDDAAPTAETAGQAADEPTAAARPADPVDEAEPDRTDDAETDDEPADSEPTDAVEPDQTDDVEINDDPVDSIKGIGPAYADRLADAGVDTVGELAAADAAELADQTDLSEKRIQGWIDRAELR
ncbi:helix-hairpin-helix domain-containing protein [Natrinema ejinorense]|uniref:Helix-hairpin-helix domain-containing protein n=1 Tax=Natrinema ejinorense TaxID=373386 RepID=A0A2A5QXP1_9EURY|nr:DUF4332 domain-containing protein [Natrinema ejinorense]PCR91587.1 hypothetical protein CP557_14260 [Natrinema ejinorense]